MKKIIKKFTRNKRANISIMAAVSLPVMLLSAGVAIDYGNIVKQRNALKAALDTAALAGINEGLISYKNEEDINLNKVVKYATQQAFWANVKNISSVEFIKQNLKVKTRVNDNNLIVNLNYKTNYIPLMMQFAGYNKIPLSIESNAEATAAKYVNVNFLFDVSASMGIAATYADEQIVASETNCAFACHINDTAARTSAYEKVKAAGAKLRIDVARESAFAAVDRMSRSGLVEDQVSFSVTLFDNIPYEVVPVNSSRATDLDYVKNRISDTVHMQVTNGGTNLEDAMTKILADIPKSGSGRVKDDRIQYLVVLSDGIENAVYNSRTQGWQRHPNAKPNNPYVQYGNERNTLYSLNTKSCKKINSKKINTYFIQTPYIIPTLGKISNFNVSRFGGIETIHTPKAKERFEQCAGDPDNVIQAGKPDEIEEAFDKILGNLAKPLHLN